MLADLVGCKAKGLEGTLTRRPVLALYRLYIMSNNPHSAVDHRFQFRRPVTFSAYGSNGRGLQRRAQECLALYLWSRRLLLLERVGLKEVVEMSWRKTDKQILSW